MVHVRKLVKAGQTSHTISLPKEWLEKNKLNKGDTLYVHEKENNLVVSTQLNSQQQKNKEITIEFNNKEVESLQRELTSAYLNNYNTINIVGRKTKDHGAEIKKMLQSFVALEISEQTEQKVVIKDLLSLEDVDVVKTLRRMDMIVRSMFKDLNEKNDQLHFKDEDVNKNYFLVFRLLKRSLQDTNLAEQFNIRPEQVLSYWYLAVNVENLADCCTNISTKLNDNVKKVINTLEEQYNHVMNNFFSKNKTGIEQIAQQRNKIIEEINQLPEGVSENLKQILTLINNIARIVMDDE